MSTNPVTPKQTAANVLGALAEANGYVNLALQLGTALIPVGKALVSKIKDATTGVETISYQLLITQDQAILAAIDASSIADLQAINAELERQGAQTLPVPSGPPPSQG